MLQPQSKRHHLHDPIAACGDRVYIICSQNGLFPDTWGGHTPREMWGVWAHPIKLLDGFWFGVSEGSDDPPQWLCEATECRAGAGYTEFDYRTGPLRVTRRDLAPDGVVGAIITLTIHATDPRPLTLHALFRSDLRPAWLGEEAGMQDGADSAVIRRIGHSQAQASSTQAAGYDFTSLRDAPRPVQTQTPNTNAVCVFEDAANPWACVVGADHAPSDVTTGRDVWAVNRTHGQGTSAHFKYGLSPLPNGEAEGPRSEAEGRLGEGAYHTSLTFFIAGSDVSETDAMATYARLSEQHAQLAQDKRATYQHIAETSQLITPDAQLNEAAAWSKVINQMFMREVPGIGRGVGAGMPEYPWWFGIDTEYAVLPMLQSGQFELVRDTLRLLKAQSERLNPNEPGRVIHELSSVGVAFNTGNMVEVPAFTRAVHQYWEWTGDTEFLREMYPFCKAGLLDHALGQHDPDGDLHPNGRSIIETVEMHAGFEVVDVAAYTWEAFTRLADMAPFSNNADAVPEFKAKADVLAQRIREEWWLEDEGLFADVRASVDEVERVLADLDRQAMEQGWLLEQQKFVETARDLFKPYQSRFASARRDQDLPWLLRHWVVMCPVEVGIATSAQAQRVLARLQSDEFSNAWGMYLHPDRRDVMSINTGLLALSAARYGHVNDALTIVAKMVRAFGYRTPGAVCEALPGDWCFLQLWSNLGLVSPAVECFLGITPRAAERTLTIKPNLPAAWGWAEVKRLRVGDASFDIRVERDGEGYRVDVQGADGWTIEK
jgi:glycogen debranching enzyme